MSESNTSRQDYHHGNLRQALMQAASGFVAKNGPEKLSLRALAREVGVSQAAPYRHFEDKVSLLSALASEGFQRLGEKLEQAVTEANGNPIAALTGTGRAYIRFACDNPEIYRLMFVMKASEFNDEEMRSCHHDAHQILGRVIEMGLDSGVFKAYPADKIALTAWSMVHGYASLVIDGIVELNEEDPVQQLEAIAQILNSGVVNQSD